MYWFLLPLFRGIGKIRDYLIRSTCTRTNVHYIFIYQIVMYFFYTFMFCKIVFFRQVEFVLQIYRIESFIRIE